MSRADVHYALAIDHEIWEAASVDPSLLDPVVRTDAVPGTSHPFVVVRDYQGPQGQYLERFTIADSTGRELFASPERKVSLRGEQFEDRLVTRIPRLVLDRGDEHQLTFFVNGEEVNTVPMFVEVGGGGDVSVMAEETLSKALGKGAIMWILVERAVKVASPKKKMRKRPRGLVYEKHQSPAWFVLDKGVIYVFSGPTEQVIEGLTPDTDEVEIVARSKDHRTAVVRTTAKVEVVPTDDPRWEKAATEGMGKRLNLPDGEGAVDRWRENCTLYALTPQFAGAPVVAAAGAGAQAAAAAAPAEEKKEVKKRPEDDIHVEAQIDQAVFDQMIAEGKSERVARSKAKAAYVRAEKKRILAEQGGGGE